MIPASDPGSFVQKDGHDNLKSAAMEQNLLAANFKMKG